MAEDKIQKLCDAALKEWIKNHGGRHPNRLSLNASERNLALWEKVKKQKE